MVSCLNLYLLHLFFFFFLFIELTRNHLRFIGSTLICAAQNVGMLSVGRVINGIAVGIESSQVPVYISELAPPSKRGGLVGMQQWAVTWGILIMY